MNWLKKFIILGIVAIPSLAIAQSASARFVVFVVGNDDATLQRVRTVSPTAFATKINDQPAIQAGTFNSESSADSLAIALQQSGLAAQKYFRSSEGKENNVQVPFTDSITSMPSPSVAALPNPQQVVIQQNPVSQPVSFQTDTQQQILSSAFQPAPQQATAYNNQYQQITTNTVVPQVQTQQVLVPRWQQVLVPETRQFVTQTVVPQTQIVQTGSIQSGSIQSGSIQSGSIQSGSIQSGYVQPTVYNQQATTAAAYVQPTVYNQQATSYVQPQTGFITSSAATVVPATYDNAAATNFVAQQPQIVQSQIVQPQIVQSQAVATTYNTGAYTTGYSNEPQLPQASQNSNFRYIAAVPAAANNQALLARVRQYVPSAFFASSGRGVYIHAGAYQGRDSAESVARYLRSQGVDSRVLYF